MTQITNEPCLLLGANGALTIGVTKGALSQTQEPCQVLRADDRFKGINQATGEIIFDFPMRDEPTKSAVNKIFHDASESSREPRLAIWFMTEEGMHPFQRIIPA